VSHLYDVAPDHAAAGDARLPGTRPAALIDWMVFDLGNVVLYQNAGLPELARRIGAPASLAPEEFVDAYNAPRRDYDRHSDPDNYWSKVAAACGAPAPNAATIAELITMDVAVWSGTEPAVIDLFAELHSAGIRLAVLSNAPTSMGDHVRRQPWAQLFEKIVISGEIGLLKPDAEIYDYLLRELASPAGRVAFTDDLAENIAGADAAGIRGIRFHGVAALRSSLQDFGAL
jgi:putative hydrolase of the HAD superfamily